MGELFIDKLACLSESKVFNKDDIYEKLFDKKCDKRYPETVVQKFLNLNKKQLEFLGVEAVVEGTGNDIKLYLKSSRFIGAIPVRMPHDGLCHKDLQVLPRFDKSDEAFSELNNLLGLLEYSVHIEYLKDSVLVSPYHLRPPLYYEAAKYLEFFNDVIKYKWKRFQVEDRSYRFPKANTNWNLYAVMSANVQNRLNYPSHTSVLSMNHKEMQELKYVFELAREIIQEPSVPASIRLKYQDIIAGISKRIEGISVTNTTYLQVEKSEPACVQAAKKQGNVILQKNGSICTAWRLDSAELFERYAQYIMEKCATDYSGAMFANQKITGKGMIPQWGLKYLEPDMLIKMNDGIIMADAKYKAHFYGLSGDSEVLKDTHRHDLHQLLAYCSFEPQANKVGVLIYPAEEVSFRQFEYYEHLGHQTTKVLLCGIPFGVANIPEIQRRVKDDIFPLMR